jgi:hypothetical protein
MALEKELTVYRQELSRLLEEGEAGKFALIQGDQVVCVWDTYRDATPIFLQRQDWRARRNTTRA